MFLREQKRAMEEEAKRERDEQWERASPEERKKIMEDEMTKVEEAKAEIRRDRKNREDEVCLLLATVRQRVSLMSACALNRRLSASARRGSRRRKS